MNDAINLADHAAQQSDRWMFVAMFIILLAVLLVTWRWIVADRAKLGERLTKITDRHIETCEKMTEVVTNNTNALNQVKDAVAWCRSR